jgi:hypothetical protein
MPPSSPGIEPPEAIAARAMAAPDAAQNELLWRVVAEQPYGPPLDEAVLARWPDSAEATSLTLERARHASLLRPEWRRAALARALDELGRKPVAAADLVTALGDPAALSALDDALLARWPAPDAAAEIARRLDPASRGDRPPPSAAWRTRALQKSHDALQGPEVARAVALTLLVGNDADRAAALDAELDAWPARVPEEVLERHVAIASAPWREHAQKKALALVERWKRHAPGVAPLEAARAAELLSSTARDDAPCARLAELKETAALDPGWYVKLPPRCRPR